MTSKVSIKVSGEDVGDIQCSALGEYNRSVINEARVLMSICNSWQNYVGVYWTATVINNPSDFFVCKR